MSAKNKNGSASIASYLISLSVRGVKCFGDKQMLDLSDGNGSYSKWNIILGDNGTGKTTLLDCLAMMDDAFVHFNYLESFKRDRTFGINASIATNAKGASTLETYKFGTNEKHIFKISGHRVLDGLIYAYGANRRIKKNLQIPLNNLAINFL